MEVRRCLRRWRKGKGGKRTYKKEKKNYARGKRKRRTRNGRKWQRKPTLKVRCEKW